MSLTISGTILEKESRLPVAGLMVRAFDKRHLYDDLLPMAMTRADGRFLLKCQEADTPQLFQTREEIHISIYALPCQFLMDVERAIPTGTSELKHEDLVLDIPRSILGDLSPSRSAGKVEGGVNFTLEQMTLEKYRDYDIPRIPGFVSGGAPGAPTLLSQIHTIALPYEAKNLQLKVIPGQSEYLPGPINPYPVQPPAVMKNIEPGMNSRFPSYNLPSAVFMPLDVRLFEKGKAYPGELVVLGPVSEYMGIKYVTIKVSPVQYDHAVRVFVCYPHLSYICTYEMAATVLSTTSRSYKWGDFNQIRAEQMGSFLNQPNVYQARELYHTPPEQLIISSQRNVPYVIITDDYFWDKTEIPTGKGTRAPNIQQGRGLALPLDSHGKSKNKSALSLESLGKNVTLPLESDGKSTTFHFERLAQWKSSRGMRTQVVTISDIVRKKWGDFTENDFARDLQEVIHNFIKYIHTAWGTDYVLLGGSRNIVPMRELTGYITCQGNYPAWDFSGNYPTPENGALDQPPPRCVYLDATKKTARLCHDTSLPLVHKNNWPNSQMSLCTTTGDIIPFKTTKPGDDTLGWYFANQDYSPLFDTQGNLATEPVRYDMPNRWPNKYPGNPTVTVCNIIVEVPPPSIDHDYYWVPPSPSERLLPSDLYYSVTLTHPALHDFDWNGNGLYGQYFWDGNKEVSLDNTKYLSSTTRPQVWVGRAPIATIEDAQTFVDKVLTYETLQAPDGTPVDRDYLRRVVYGADLLNEFFPPSQIPDPTKGYPNPPDQGNFNFQPGKLMIHLQDDLFADINNSWGQDQIWSNPNVVLRFYSIWPEVSTDIEIPSNYSLNGKTDLHYQTGWYFVDIVDNQLIQSSSPTHIVVFFAENLIIQPDQIFWFPNQRMEQRPDDGNDSTRLKEDTRGSIETNFPGFTEERRYYADYFGLLQTGIPVERLNVNSIRSTLDSGCHFVSLSGHGGSQGCCNVWWATFNPETLHSGPYSKGYWICPDFKNDKRYYIVFANSCYTAKPDDPLNTSLGERMVLDPKGGAVAYVGNVRTGVAECRFQERTFWWNLKRNGRIGPAAGIPPNDLSSFWVRYELMLYGDPEMPVWTDIPGDYQVLSTVEVPTDEVIHAQAIPGEVIKIAVFSNNQPVQKQQVTFMGGWSGSENDPLILKILETDDAGLVHFAVPVDAVAGDLLTMTITPPFAMNGHDNFKPYVMSIFIIRPPSS